MRGDSKREQPIVNGYTLGNPAAYEPLFVEGAAPSKGIGGVVFRSRAEAAAILDHNDGMLPGDWFEDGRPRPGRVYGLLKVDWSLVELDGWEQGQHKLLAPVLLLRLDRP